MSQRTAIFAGTEYTPIDPTPDTDELAESGARIVLYHSPHGSHIAVAAKGEMHAGWVVGLVHPFFGVVPPATVKPNRGATPIQRAASAVALAKMHLESIADSSIQTPSETATLTLVTAIEALIEEATRARRASTQP